MKIRSALTILVIAIIIGTGIIKYPSELQKYTTTILELTRLKNIFKRPYAFAWVVYTIFV